MEILLLVNDQQHGPYTEEQIRQFIISGQVTPNTLAWWEGMPEWKMLEDLPKFSHLMISSESQGEKSKKLKHTLPIASMKCLAVGLWLVLAMIILVDVITVFPILNLQGIPVGIGFFFHITLFIPPLLATHLMFRRFCPKYFGVLGTLGLGFLWGAVNLSWEYLDGKDKGNAYLLLVIPFSLALLHGWKQGVVGFRQSFYLDRPNDGRTQAIIGLILMLLLTCAFFWIINVFLPSGKIQWKYVLGIMGTAIVVILIFVAFTRGLNRLFSFGSD